MLWCNANGIAAATPADAVGNAIYAYIQCVAVCCSVLQCAAVCCSVLQCASMCYSLFQCVAIVVAAATAAEAA